jgi:hypothetical protein
MRLLAAEPFAEFVVAASSNGFFDRLFKTQTEHCPLDLRLSEITPLCKS